jgi:DUF438 domain-containing protein
MSELINNSTERKKTLKHLILRLHKGETPDEVRKELVSLLHKIPHSEIVEVEQELINEGLPEVEQILNDFKSGKASRAPFWIQMNDRFIHIECFALRDENGSYLGTLEVSQDITEIRQLEGEQRLLTYTKKTNDNNEEEFS